MPIKLTRDEDDIEVMAEALAQRWRRGDGIEPFLRGLEPELSRRVREEHWSWESLALAFNRAGITYQSGRVWNGRTLGNKIRDIRFKMRARARRAVSDARAKAHGAISAATGPPVIQEMRDTLLDEVHGEPEFRPATLLGWKRPAATDAALARVNRPAAPPKEAVDVDAVIARLIGQK